MGKPAGGVERDALGYARLIDDFPDRFSETIAPPRADRRHVNRADKKKDDGDIGLGRNGFENRRMGVGEKLRIGEGPGERYVEVALDQAR